MIKPAITLLIVTWAAGDCWAARWPYDGIPIMTEDFGPRIPPPKPDGKFGSAFHRGLDLVPATTAALNAPIKAVEAGAIREIRQSGTLWILEVLSPPDRKWRYLHIFSGVTLSTEPGGTQHSTTADGRWTIGIATATDNDVTYYITYGLEKSSLKIS